MVPQGSTTATPSPLQTPPHPTSERQLGLISNTRDPSCGTTEIRNRREREIWRYRRYSPNPHHHHHHHHHHRVDDRVIIKRSYHNMKAMLKLKVVMFVILSGLVFYKIIPYQTPQAFLLTSGEQLHSQEIQKDSSTLAKEAESSGFPIYHPNQKRTQDTSSQGSPATGPSLMPRHLLVTSVGRSGSSFFGELLASHGGNIYFFEPVRALKESPHNETLVRAEILRTFQCDIRQELIHLDKYPYENIKHNYTRGKNKDEIELSKLNQICMKEPLRIVKSIRSRLSWTKQLLEEEDLDLKVIHLVRDPRGTYLSMAKVRWDVTPRSVCDKVLQDLKEREVMERLYPDRYFFVKYEDICRDPYGQARAIFRFLRGEPNVQNKYSDHLNHRDDPSLHDATKGGGPMLSHQSKAEDNVALARAPKTKTKRRLDPGSLSDLPKGVLAYLQSHTRVNMFTKKSPWTTVRDTPSIYQSWRKTITQMELTYLETQCREVIQTLRHRLFGTVDIARNLSISLSEDPEIPVLQKQETL